MGLIKYILVGIFAFYISICNVKTSFVVTLLLFDNFIKPKLSKHCKLVRAPSIIRLQ